jgi:hypothetical protein
MLTVAITLGAVVGAAVLAVLLVVTVVAWLARASERAYRMPPAARFAQNLDSSVAGETDAGPASR